MSGPAASPRILGLVSDLFFAAPIESAARSGGFEVHWLEAGRVTEEAPAALLHQVVDEQAALVVIELGNGQVPWERWVTLLKTSPATRRLPILAFGPHVDAALLARARQAGCDQVLARSAFMRDLPGLLEKHARRPDAAALAADCLAPLSAQARAGIEQFNRGEYFEAHETLEHAWNGEPGPARELYRALLQTAVAYLQIQRGNFAGAEKMFLRLRQWLDPLPAECRGVDVDGLRADVQAARQALAALGPGRLAEFDARLLKPIRIRQPG